MPVAGVSSPVQFFILYESSSLTFLTLGIIFLLVSPHPQHNALFTGIHQVTLVPLPCTEHSEDNAGHLRKLATGWKQNYTTMFKRYHWALIC